MIKQVDRQKKLVIGQDWQTQLANAVSSIDELLSILELTEKRDMIYIPERFGLRVPRAFVEKMEVGNIDDPLLKQVLPSRQETIAVSGFVSDPLAENQYNPIKGLLHKYRSRILLTVTGACAIHCRYCFRQHFDYSANLPNRGKSSDKQADKQNAVLDYIVSHSEVDEVILSGGDPLSLSNRRLAEWLDKLSDLSQIRSIRLHSRLPVVLPARIDDDILELFADILKKGQCQLVMVIHCNHANEIDEFTIEQLQTLQKVGVVLLNQAVLLKGINDNVATQMALSQRLLSAGVLPYYLHLLDKVAGAAHFDCSEMEAVRLYWQMLESMSGYLVPKLVRELPDKPFKTPINIYQKIS